MKHHSDPSYKTKAIMVIGTGSGVGKSIICAGLLRAFSKRGIRCAPFKAQNMALNSYVTADGKEMGRAQVYQAEAAGLAPDVRMNPILLKPNGDCTSQVIVLGEPEGTFSARDYYRAYPRHKRIVEQAYSELSQGFDLMVLEGAGSPAEINLQDRDLVNMKMAAYANAYTILVGDIEKGGVFAWLKGTLDLLEPPFRPLVRGLLINKFRGDKGLLAPGLRAFEHVAGLPFLGVLPYLDGITVDQEDGMFTHLLKKAHDKRHESVVIGVPRPPRISNFTDFIPFSIEPDCTLDLIMGPEDLDGVDCVIIPGSKATCSDLEFLENTGLAKAIKELVLRDRLIVVGICGGYQMLGETIEDPDEVEGTRAFSKGLGLLPLKTRMLPRKVLKRRGLEVLIPGIGTHTVFGYEIHMGVTSPMDGLDEARGGAIARDETIGFSNKEGTVFGTYLHGIFENDAFRRAFLNRIRVKKGLSPVSSITSYSAFKGKNLDTLSHWIESNMDLDSVLKDVGIG